MGAWGHGSFDNDDAMDLVGFLIEGEDLEAAAEALDADLIEQDYIEATESSAGLAAAEIVAAFLGQAQPDLPEDLAEWIAAHPKLTTVARALLPQARRLLERVLDDGQNELHALWAENAAQHPLWIAGLTDLERRLSLAAAQR